jgi:hypothetical protein
MAGALARCIGDGGVGDDDGERKVVNRTGVARDPVAGFGRNGNRTLLRESLGTSNMKIKSKNIDMRTAVKLAVVIIFASYIGRVVLQDELGSEYETEALIGPLTGMDLFVGGILLGVSIITLWFLYTGSGALATGVRILLHRPVTAAQARHQDDVIEVQGTAERIEGHGPIGGKYSGQACLAYSWKERRVERDRNDDRPVRRTKRTGKGAVPFYVSDETGTVAIDPANATLSIRRRLEDRDRSVRYITRKYEGRIHPGDTVHVYGPKQEPATAGNAPGEEQFHVGTDDSGSTFKVSDTTAFRTALRSLVRGGVYALFGVVLFAFAAFSLFGVSI